MSLKSSLYLFLPTTFRRNHSKFLSAYVYLPPTYHSNPIITKVMILWSLFCIHLQFHTSVIKHRYTDRHGSEENQGEKKCGSGRGMLNKNQATYFSIISMGF